IDESGVATVTITVKPVNDPPVAANDGPYQVNEDTTLTVDAGTGVLANDTDLEGDALTAIPVATTVNGALTLNPDGSFTYVPNADFSGLDSFPYGARDNSSPALDSSVATVIIEVAAVNDPPVAANDGPYDV